MAAPALNPARIARLVRVATFARMIDHTGFNVSDPATSRAFYESALAPLGYSVMFEGSTKPKGGLALVGMGCAPAHRKRTPPKPDFWLTEGTPAKPRPHVAFRAASHARVDAFYKAAMAAGGRDNGPPGPRPDYDADYYAAFVLDPDGHNVEAVCHKPVA